MIITKRNRTSAKDIGYGLYLYILGLLYRNTAKALPRFVKRSHVTVWKWIQKYKPERTLMDLKLYTNLGSNNKLNLQYKVLYQDETNHRVGMINQL